MNTGTVAAFRVVGAHEVGAACHARAMSFSVHVARADDADELARVHVDGWRWGYRGVLPAAFLDGLSVEARVARWRDILAKGAPQERTWMACDALGGVGFASIGPHRGEPAGAELYAIYVVERVAGSDVARRLMACAMEGMRALEERRGFLWVLENNPRARGFYEREGWRADGVIRREEIGGVTVQEVRYEVALEARV